MKQYKFLLFDWDGTLVNSLPVWIRAYKKLFKKYGITVSGQEILSKAYGNPKGCVNFGITNYDNFNVELFELVLETYYKASMFKGALNILTLLKENSYKLALITNTPNALIQSYFKENKLPDLFDVIITRDDVLKLKPNPEGYKKALAQLGVAKKLYKTVLVVGDSLQDIVAGDKLGIDCALFEPRKTDVENNINYDPKIKTLNELKNIIRVE